MHDSTYSHELSSEPSPSGDDLAPDEIPQFGAVDIVEAFTAMRHEWREQTKESRSLAERIQQAVASLQSLDERSQTAASTTTAPEARQLALVIVETDHQLSRAVAAIAQGETNQRQREASAAQAVERHIAAMGVLARWFSRPLLALLAGQRSVQTPVEEHPAVAGLNMVLARLRRMMHEQGIERLDVQGQPFDAETMHAIGTVASTACPPGSVGEQASPAYRWHGKLLRFADVWVADPKRQG